MTTDRVNYLNTGLMILSCIVAFLLPFELFLFSYAILGPLHYLTEMSWLHKRQYFAPGKYDYMVLAALVLIILFPTLFKLIYHLIAAKDAYGHTVLSGGMLVFARRSTTVGRVMIFVSFTTAAVIVLIRNTWKRAIAIALILVFGLLTRSAQFGNIIFAIFLPTLIHVFVFTGVFIIAGALKSRSLSGIISFVVFLACAISLFLLFPNPVNTSGVYVLSRYDTGLSQLNRQIFATFLHQQAGHNDLYYSRAGILITRFIAYAYTYHYLNWFSKTSVIKWHLIPTRSLIIILSVWLLSLMLYFTNYRTGLAVLYFLSLMHVIFEFPLNFQSFRDIGRSVKWKRKAVA